MGAGNRPQEAYVDSCLEKGFRGAWLNMDAQWAKLIELGAVGVLSLFVIHHLFKYVFSQLKSMENSQVKVAEALRNQSENINGLKVLVETVLPIVRDQLNKE